MRDFVHLIGETSARDEFSAIDTEPLKSSFRLENKKTFLAPEDTRAVELLLWRQEGLQDKEKVRYTTA